MKESTKEISKGFFLKESEYLKDLQVLQGEIIAALLVFFKISCKKQNCKAVLYICLPQFTYIY